MVHKPLRHLRKAKFEKILLKNYTTAKKQYYGLINKTRDLYYRNLAVKLSKKKKIKSFLSLVRSIKPIRKTIEMTFLCLNGKNSTNVYLNLVKMTCFRTTPTITHI